MVMSPKQKGGDDEKVNLFFVGFGVDRGFPADGLRPNGGHAYGHGAIYHADHRADGQSDADGYTDRDGDGRSAVRRHTENGPPHRAEDALPLVRRYDGPLPFLLGL